MAAQFTATDLDQFFGTEQWYRHWTRKLLYTEGVHFLVEHGASWLVDAIASYQGTKELDTPALQQFQLWELVVNRPGTSATLTCRADSDRYPVVTQEIEFTDFPLDSIKLYVESSDKDLVLMLPSER